MNTENHKFYNTPSENKTKPPWFIICNRIEAEEILVKHSDYGNVLIRKNSSFDKNGSYALSATAKCNGGTKFVHYVISRSPNGFKLEVNTAPASMACLKDVLDYYINAAGYQTHHAMVVDPTEQSKPSNTCQRRDKGRDYVNIPDAKNRPVSDELYLKMHGNTKKATTVQRHCSSPVVKRDYINVPKGTTASAHDSAIYLNTSETEMNIAKGSSGRDYINVPKVLGRGSHASKTNSYTAYGQDVDEGCGDTDDDGADYLAPCDN